MQGSCGFRNRFFHCLKSLIYCSFAFVQSNQLKLRLLDKFMKRTKIVIVGGGAGGLELARRLGLHFRRQTHDVLLIDKNRTHIWKPLLHEVATGSLDANLDEVGYGGHGIRWGYRFFNGTFSGIDRVKKVVFTDPLYDENGNEVISAHEINYDYLVLAVGGVSNDFGISGVKTHAMFLENRRQADNFRARLLNSCFRVSHSLIKGDNSPVVNLVIVGGGATGVELSAELLKVASSLRHYGLTDFDENRIQLTLLEAGDRLLPALPEKLSIAATEELTGIGVEVRLNTVVSKVKSDQILTKAGDKINSDITVWAAGVRGAKYLTELDGLATDRLDRLIVNKHLQTTHDPAVFAMGDCASFTPPGATKPLPPRAQAAHQMARVVFENIKSLTEGKDLKPFIYNDRGSLVSLSRFSTVGSLMGNLIGGRLAIEGRLARIAYMSLYRLHLLAIHGWLRGAMLILLGHVNRIARPKLKVH